MYSGKKAQHDFPKMRGGDQRPFGTFPKIHPFWKRRPSLSYSRTASEKCLKIYSAQSLLDRPDMTMVTNAFDIKSECLIKIMIQNAEIEQEEGSCREDFQDDKY